jgi:hypothetical protein
MSKNDNLSNWLYGIGVVAGIINFFVALFTFIRFSNPITQSIVIVFDQYGNPSYRLLQTIANYAVPQLPIYLMMLICSVATLVAWKWSLAGGIIIFVGLLSMLGLPLIGAFPLLGLSELFIPVLSFLLTLISGVFFILSGLEERKDKNKSLAVSNS